ncbi:sugar transferase [Methylocella tundrae]|uniref:sugar transferase n=1 Tax=Methylocella tundrae TaxID=227605 RepID=UPI001FCE506A|nr:sugar transferase [Methylocella tundrae]WPP03290.1 sugar transferase [Methylocella tundrae]
MIELSLTVEQRPVGGAGKRGLDIFLATIGLILLSPILLLCAITILAVSRDKILFRHRRLGLHGESFDCLKFQTMVRDGDRVLRDYLETHPEARAEWESTRKLRNDPRVTAFGKVLRKTSVDELPQLINVLKGEMSIIGPRPIVEQELTKYGVRRQAYLICRPGITGLWQISGRSNTTYRRRVACDACYAKHWSLALDAQILIRTLPVVFGSSGAY